MFLGISHILLATDSKNKKNFIESLKGVGYKIDFEESKLVNRQEKLNFVFNKNQFHNVTYLKHKSRYAIEVIEYENIENSKTNLWISFKDKLDKNDIEIYKRLDKSIYFNKILNLEYFISDENRFIIKTSNLEKEINFWNELNFKNINNKIHIESPLVQWKGKIDFLESDCQYNFMDNIGANSICILTNSINNDYVKIKADRSKVFKMIVNNKEMNILFIKRESFTLELLEIR